MKWRYFLLHGLKVFSDFNYRAFYMPKDMPRSRRLAHFTRKPIPVTVAANSGLVPAMFFLNELCQNEKDCFHFDMVPV